MKKLILLSLSAGAFALTGCDELNTQAEPITVEDLKGVIQNTDSQPESTTTEQPVSIPSFNQDITSVPEPMSLLGLGLVAGAMTFIKRKS